ncbi:MAG: hypothetical protein JRE29_14230 [Deltaproteobacteria bacterium]|nr:hypothetical protein [Deltaproteobacteria bacterium]
MKIIIRYLGMSIIEKDLQPGEYTIGRAKDNDIKITHESMQKFFLKMVNGGIRIYE